MEEGSTQVVVGALLQILALSVGNEFRARERPRHVRLQRASLYCRYGVSYRDLEQMMGERGVFFDHSTIYRYVQRYAPEMEKQLRWQWRTPR